MPQAHHTVGAGDTDLVFGMLCEEWGLLIALLASVGTMGVPGAALIMLSMIFTHVGIPLEAIALVAGIDRVMDMARTTINVLGDATAAIFISRTENDFDPQRGAALQDE